MWIRGYKLVYGIVPPYPLQEYIKELVRQLAIKHECDFKASVHSEACYLTINDRVISFRNHPGRPSDIDIYLSDFKTWQECEEFFEKEVLPSLNK